MGNDLFGCSDQSNESTLNFGGAWTRFTSFVSTSGGSQMRQV